MSASLRNTTCGWPVRTASGARPTISAIRWRRAAAGTLYGLQAEYVLIFINNPGCAMCREIREAITASPMLSEMIERGRLEVLAIYPDEDLTEWKAYRDQIPASWINAYDKGCRISSEGLYDLHAIPALYLLDRDKRVLVKDSTDVAQIEEVIDRRG